MKSARAIFSTVVFLGMGVCAAQSGSSAPVPLTLSLTQTAKATEFRVELHNNGTEALNLILGMALANGEEQYVTRVSFSLQMSDGKLVYLEPTGPGFITGRVDPLIVPLPPGASFSYLVDLANCWAPKEKIIEFHLAPGKYTVTAKYTGEPISKSTVNLDVPGIALIPFWTGTVTSSPIAVTVSAPEHK